MVAGALAMEDTQERSPAVLLLDEGSAAINEQRGAVTVAPEHRAGRSGFSILCRDAEGPRCWSLGIACKGAASDRCQHPPRAMIV
jgi:hypothetical protein